MSHNTGPVGAPQVLQTVQYNNQFINDSRTLSMLRAFISNPLGIGAISPSSRALAEAMAGNLPIKPGELIVEFGPGSGALTEVIHKRLDSTANYLGIELDNRLSRLLCKRFPELSFVNDSVQNFSRILTRGNLHPPRIIVSGLPFSTQSIPFLDSVIDNLDRVMVTGSEFRTYQYLHAFRFPAATYFREKMDSIFTGHQRSPVIVKNLPPAVVLTWKRKNDSTTGEPDSTVHLSKRLPVG